MSSNNQLIVRKNKGYYEVHYDGCVDNDFESSEETLLKKFKDFKVAIKYANRYWQEEGIEYGVYIEDNCLT